jgi:hypothetical protein
LIPLKFFSSEKISWLSSGVQSFKAAAQVAYLANMFFLNKDILFTLCHTRDVQLSNECQGTFL